MHPILLSIGPVTIRYYGLMYVIAITLGLFIISRDVKRKKLVCGATGELVSTDDMLDLLLWMIPAAIIGARIYYVAFQWGYYGSHPADIIPKRFQELNSFAFFFQKSDFIFFASIFRIFIPQAIFGSNHTDEITVFLHFFQLFFFFQNITKISVTMVFKSFGV